jgi:hypothetical protein
MATRTPVGGTFSSASVLHGSGLNGLPGGIVAYAALTNNVSGNMYGLSLGTPNPPDFAVTFTPQASRIYRISILLTLACTVTPASTTVLDYVWQKDGVNLFSTTHIFYFQAYGYEQQRNITITGHLIENSPTAVAHTYSVYGSDNDGTNFQIAADPISPGYFLIEDMGPTF